MTFIPPVFNFEEWIAEHQHLLQPPVNNQQMWKPMGDFIVQVVGGPNVRTDYHLDPYEEWFYQYRGDMHINLMTDDGPVRIDIREGEMWVLPRNVYHSPQRPTEGSIGIVIERIREEGTREQFVWFCLECGHLVHAAEIQLRDIVVDLPPVFESFYQSRTARTCGKCGALHPGKG
ncbi:MAG TPA: 3-hydroxyanthranilate 3,4-dioxygenase [Mycobacterium sp.]|nr:3-hydroxyanthranilate 3,4-dioxygenase [Mycobacterium sp.]